MIIFYSLARKKPHFVQSKPHATKSLEDRMKKGTLDKLYFYLLYLQEHLSKMLYIPTKSTVLPKISTKWAGIAFLVKIKNKMLMQTIMIL